MSRLPHNYIKLSHGDTVNNVVYIEEAGKIRYGSQYYRQCKFRCQCGKEFITTLASARSGQTRSCGCFRDSFIGTVNLKHGMSHKNPVHRTWLKIKERCYSENCPQYPSYGGRGIVLYKEWEENFMEFYDYVKSLPNFDEQNIGKYKKYTLDRINNDLGYIPGNLRWATATEQVINRRTNKNNKSGLVGVYSESDGGYTRWRSVVGVNYERINLGSFKSKEEALAARNKYITEHNLKLPLQ